MAFQAVKNPTRGDLMRLSEGGTSFRAVRDPATGDTFAWPASDASHADVAQRLGLDFKTRDEVARNSFLFSRQQLDETPDARDLEQLINEMAKK